MTRCTLTFLLCVCASFVLNAQCRLPDDRDAAVLTLDSAVYCFDTVAEGTVIEYRFRFSNTGVSPLLIQNVFIATGMLVAESPREPILSGQSGEITVTLNTTGRSGPIDKIVSIESNNRSGTVLLHLKGFVVRNAAKGPVITFDSATYSYDTISQGAIIYHEYRFTNTGDAPLMITLAVGSYGGLITEYSKEPVAPGERGVIKVKYDAAGKAGMQDQAITVESNSIEGNVTLHITGFVVPAKSGR